MCPFCIAALAAVAAKAIAGASSGAIITRVVVNKLQKAEDSAETRFAEEQPAAVKD